MIKVPFILAICALLIGFLLAGLAFYNDRKKRFFMRLWRDSLGSIKALSTTWRNQEQMLLDYAYEMEDAVTDVTALHADLRDTIAERDKQIRALNQQTAPMPPIYEKPAPKRTRPKKASSNGAAET